MLLEWVLFTGFVRLDVAFWLTLLLLTTTTMVNTIYEKCYRKATFTAKQTKNTPLIVLPTRVSARLIRNAAG